MSYRSFPRLAHTIVNTNLFCTLVFEIMSVFRCFILDNKKCTSIDKRASWMVATSCLWSSTDCLSILITTLACQFTLIILLFIIGLVNQISISNSILFQSGAPRLLLLKWGLLSISLFNLIWTHWACILGWLKHPTIWTEELELYLDHGIRLGNLYRGIVYYFVFCCLEIIGHTLDVIGCLGTSF